MQKVQAIIEAVVFYSTVAILSFLILAITVSTFTIVYFDMFN